MMLYKSIQMNHTYKGQKEINFPKGDPQGKRNVVFLCTPSFLDSLKLLSDPSIHLKESFYTRYMIDTRYREQVGRKTINENQIANFRDSFSSSEAAKNLTYIPIAQKETTLKKKYNVVFDVSHWNEIFFKFRKKTNVEGTIQNYLQFISQKVNDPSFNGFTKIMVIPATQWASKGVAQFGVTREYLDDPISILMAACYKYPEYLQMLKGIHLYIVDPENGNFVLIDPASLNEKSYSMLKRELFKFPAIKFAAEEEDQNAPKSIPPVTPGVLNKKDAPVPNNFLKTSEETREKTISDIKNKIISEESPKNKVISTQKSNMPNIPPLPSGQLNTPTIQITKVVNDNGKIVEKRSEINLPPVVTNQNSPDEVQKNETEMREEIDEEIQSFVTDDEDIDPDTIDAETETSVKRNVLISKFRPEFSADEKIRISNLQKKQNELLAQSIPEMKTKIIEPASLKGIVKTKNKTILQPKSKNFTKSYNEKKLEPDIDAAIAALANTEFPIFITGKTVEDTSDTLNAKKTYTYSFEDYQGNKFSTKFDMPILIDDRYIYLNGIKSVIENQLLPMPIIKSGPNEVQIIGQYNKIYLHRKETDKLDMKSQVVKKYFLNQANAGRYNVQIGNCLMKNKEFDTPLDFDNVSKNIAELTIGKFKFIFNIPKLLEIVNEDRQTKNLKPIVNGYTDDNKLVVGYNVQTKELITVDEKAGQSVLDIMMEKLPENDMTALLKTKPGTTRFTYIKGKLMSMEIPIVFFMLYCEGMTKVLEKIGVRYDVVEPGTEYDKFNRGCIKASNKWILWDKYPFHNSLLLNGCELLPTEDYTYEELDSKSTYVDMVPLFYKDSRRAFALDQFKDFMLDPISKEVLRDMNMPTDLNELLVTAAIMLNNNKSDSILDMRNVRIRNNEIFAQFVYKAFADAYLPYRKSMYKKKPDKLSVNRYLVTTNINGSAKTKMAGCKLIEGASSLNPILELEKQGAISYRGPSGINKDDGYTLPKRAFNPTMTGVIGISSSPDANVGIQRQLTLDPNIKSTRGYVEAANSDNIKDMASAELFTPAELLSPTGVMHDDGQRTAMAYKQSKYMVMTDDAQPVLVGNKVEAAIPYYMSREFVVTAQDSGEVIALENNIMVVQYKNGKRDSFSLDPVQQKNSAGGFYIETKFNTDLSVGNSFKKGQVLAYNPKAFSRNTNDLSASLNIGVLCKIAIVPTYDEYEDSAPITKLAAERLATSITMEQSIVINRNARVEKILKPGDHVNIGDTLAVFDDWQDDPKVADWLADLAEDLGQNVSEHISTSESSEYSGEIVDVKYYSAVDLEELSPSLRPYVEEYWTKIKAKNKVLDKYKNEDDFKTLKCGQLITEKAGKTEARNGKIFGREVNDGVLVRFFIKHKDIVKKGDKLTKLCREIGENKPC